MSLTAARTQLNVSITGQDDTARLLEEARQRMAQLEANLRRLTSATQGQAGAAGGAAAATNTFSDRMRALAGRAEDAQGKFDDFFGKTKGILDTFGDIGDIISGAIDAYTFLKDAMSSADEEAAAFTKRLKAQEQALIDTTKATEELAKIQQSSIQGQRGASLGLIQERIRLAELEGDAAKAAELRAQADHKSQMNRLEELREEIAQKTEEQILADNNIRESSKRLAAAEKDVAEMRAELAQREIEQKKLMLAIQEDGFEAGAAGNANAIRYASELEDHETRISQLRQEINSVTINTLAPEKARLETATETFKAIVAQKRELGGVLGIAEQVANALKKALSSDVLQMDVLDESGAAKKRAGGGGGRGKTKSEREREQREKAYERFKIIRDLNEEEYAIDAAKQRQLAKSALGDEVVAAQKIMKQRILQELESLPTDATSKAFQPLRAELEKQLAEIEKVTAQHAEMGFWGLPDYFDADIVNKVIDSWEAESQGIAKVDAALGKLGETRAKAIEESNEMRDAMMRAMPAEVLEKFSAGLEQLSEIQAPVFEVVQESLAGVAAQMGKFKEGQTTLTAAIVGSASAIAGAVAKNVGGVKLEAGVRAAFEVAMGIATAFTNPAESVGHFAAATAFGLIAGGVIKPSGGEASGGQKAPAAPAAATREGTMGSMSGTITNVYNLQTGIVDGQSTAMAFRRAEMTARNTGMASAGGW